VKKSAPLLMLFDYRENGEIDSKRNINTSDELDFEGVKKTVSCGYRVG